jgi:hypothetical protein
MNVAVVPDLLKFIVCVFNEIMISECSLRTRIAQSVQPLDGRPGFNSRQGQEIFMYSTVSRPALGPMQPPVQCIPGTLSPGVKRPGCEVDLLPPSRMMDLYLHSPIRHHGIVLN